MPCFLQVLTVEKKDREAVRAEEEVTFESAPGASDNGAADERELAEEVIFVVMADVLVCAQGLVAAPCIFSFVNVRPRCVVV